MLDPARHLLPCPGVALHHNLAPELTGVRAASAPAFFQIRRKAVNLTGARFGGRPLGKGFSVGKVTRCDPAHIEALGNLGNGQPNGMQCLNLLIACITPRPARLPSRHFLV